MLVCHCKRVSDSQIRAAIEDGASTVRAVSERTGAATCCGGCRPTVAALLSDSAAAAAPVARTTVIPVASVSMRAPRGATLRGLIPTAAE